MTYRVGVDLGGTKILIALTGQSGEILQSSKIPTRANKGPEIILSDLVAGLTSLFQIPLEAIEGMGFCMAGYYDRQKGVILDSPNLPGWENYPVEQRLKCMLNCPVIVENDANAAAWGEYSCGAGRGKENLLLVTLGTGIGGALIAEGRLVHGAGGLAGEIGHIPLLPGEGPLCGCGKRGCLEALVSGTAIAREGRALLKTGQQTILWDMVDEVSLQARDVFEAARQGDRCSLEVIDLAARYLGQGLAIAVNLLNPEIVIVGGGMAGEGELFLVPLRRYFSQMLIKPLAETVTLVPAELGEEAGVRGILALLDNFLSEKEKKFP